MAKYIYKIVDDLSKFEAVTEVDLLAGGAAYDDVKAAVAAIKNVMNADKELVAICAPQVGVTLRVFCVRSSDGKINSFVNPMIVSRSKGTHMSREVNPSFKGKEFIIPRADEVHVAYQHTDGRVDSNTYKGVYGEVVQQMIEMLDGVLLSDYGFDLDDVGGPEFFDAATDEEKTQVIQMYLESVKSDAKIMHDIIMADPKTKAINDQIEFTTKYLKGEIKPIDANGNIVEPNIKEAK